MQRKLFTLSALLIVSLFSTLLLAACGGGGGGGSSIPATYSGSTEQTVVTSANAEAIVTEAYEGGSQVQDTIVLPLGAQPAAPPQFKAVADLLGKVTREIPVEPSVSTMAIADQVMPGSCTGNAAITITSSTDTSASGTIVFTNYSDDCSVSLNGSVSFRIAVDSNDNLSMTVTFNSLVSSDISGSSFAFDGTFSAKFNATTEGGSMTYNVVFIDQATAKTYYFKYTITATSGVGYEDLEVTGRYYSNDYGYLVISTEVPIREYNTDSEPSSGTLHFAGANGTWATYEITGPNSYTITYYDGTNTGTITGTH